MSRFAYYGQLSVLLLLLLSACRPGSSPDAVISQDSPSGDVKTFSYQCEDPETLVVRYYQDHAGLWLDGEWLVLPRRISASGERYSDGETVFWGKGRDALFMRPGYPDQTCTLADVPDQWSDAAARGVAVRAVGQEPGWVLDIHDMGEIDFSYDYGTRHVSFDRTVASTLPGTQIYTAQAREHRLVVRVTPGPCLDSMSGEAMTRHVEVRFDDQIFKGCGRVLKQA